MARFWFCELNSNPPGKAALTVLDGDRAPRFGNPDRPRRQAPGARILRFLRFDVLQIDVSDRCCIDVVSYDTVKKGFFFFPFLLLCLFGPTGSQGLTPTCRKLGPPLSQLKRENEEKRNHHSHVSYFHLFSQLAGRLNWARLVDRQAGTGSRQVTSAIIILLVLFPTPCCYCETSHLHRHRHRDIQ